jgi:hypothetical protein
MVEWSHSLSGSPSAIRFRASRALGLRPNFLPSAMARVSAFIRLLQAQAALEFGYRAEHCEINLPCGVVVSLGVLRQRLRQTRKPLCVGAIGDRTSCERSIPIVIEDDRIHNLTAWSAREPIEDARVSRS